MNTGSQEVVVVGAGPVGIQLIHDTISDLAALMARHPTCQCFRAADGAKSGLRSVLFGTNSVVDYLLQRIVEDIPGMGVGPAG